jgi:glutamate 5-kinase
MKLFNRPSYIQNAHRIVIKIGSSLLTGKDIQQSPDLFLETLAYQINQLKKKDIVIVTSGAIALGMQKLKVLMRPKHIPKLQALASIGQSNLMYKYELVFEKFHLKLSQVLLTWDDISNRKRYENARNTFKELFEFGIIPVINENDTVSTDEIKFGDNDTLAVLVSHMIGSDLLILLTDTDGLYETDPKHDLNAKIISEIFQWDAELEKKIFHTESKVGTGGMLTKLQAAKKMMKSGVPMIIANGTKKDTLTQIFQAKPIGTFFYPKSQKMTNRKRWLTWGVKPHGIIVIDDGAQKAILTKNTSLLPSGVRDVLGTWDSGEIVRICNHDKKEIARGIINYDSEEVKKIKGCKTAEIETILGYTGYAEVIHRDNLVVLEKP